MKRLLLLVLAVSLLGLVPGTASAAAPGNDNFANATVISTVPTDLPAESNVGAMTETNEPGFFGIQATVWYRFTPAQTRDYTASLCDSDPNFTGVVSIYTGSALAGLRPISTTESGFNNCSSVPGPGQASFFAFRGVTYFIQIGGFNGGIGTMPQDTFDLKLTTGPGGLYVLDSSRKEGNHGLHAMRFTVALGVRATRRVSFHWQTQEVSCFCGPGGATDGIDYRGNHGRVSIPAGRRFGHLHVWVIGDRSVERDEQFAVNITSPRGATIGNPSAFGLIRNDDLP